MSMLFFSGSLSSYLWFVFKTKTKIHNKFKCVVCSFRQKITQTKEQDINGQLEFDEFVHYLQDHEKDLKLVFKSLDRKKTGMNLLQIQWNSSAVYAIVVTLIYWILCLVL